MTKQELDFYKKQEEEAKNKLWKIACEYGAESHGRKPYIFWEEVAKIVKENRHLFLEEYDEDGTTFNLSSLLLQKLEGKVWIENYGQEKLKDSMTVKELIEALQCLDPSMSVIVDGRKLKSVEWDEYYDESSGDDYTVVNFILEDNK